MLDDQKKVQILTHWIDGTEEVWGTIPEALKGIVTEDEAVTLLQQAMDQDDRITHQSLISYREKLEKHLDRKQKSLFSWKKSFRRWGYPIAAPLIVAVITVLILTPHPVPAPILDISVQDIFNAPTNGIGSLPFLIKNPNPFTVIVYSVGYEFSWEDFSPPNVRYEPIEPPNIIIPTENVQEQNIPSQIILTPAGSANESVQRSIPLKTPNKAGIYTITIKITTDRGLVEKKVFISIVERINQTEK